MSYVLALVSKAGAAAGWHWWIGVVLAKVIAQTEIALQTVYLYNFWFLFLQHNN